MRKTIEKTIEKNFYKHIIDKKILIIYNDLFIKKFINNN